MTRLNFRASGKLLSTFTKTLLIESDKLMKKFVVELLECSVGGNLHFYPIEK